MTQPKTIEDLRQAIREVTFKDVPAAYEAVAQMAIEMAVDDPNSESANLRFIALELGRVADRLDGIEEQPDPELNNFKFLVTVPATGLDEAQSFLVEKLTPTTTNIERAQCPTGNHFMDECDCDYDDSDAPCKKTFRTYSHGGESVVMNEHEAAQVFGGDCSCGETEPT